MENQKEKDIDIVVMWVDGNDPHHIAERQKYMTEGDEGKRDDVAGSTRYSDLGEIEYCIASINRFAPFIRKIFIITDSQNPHLEEKLSKRFPEGLIPMELVDHKVIFRSYEQYLPTFNSRSLETMMWRIPGLSEKFILMNDDFFLAAPVKAEDFFIGDKTISYTGWRLTAWAKFIHLVKPSRQGHKPIGFKDSMLNALKLAGGGSRFIYLSHTPRALKKSFFEAYFGITGEQDGRVTRHEEELFQNIRHRFRAAEQYNSQELFYLHEVKAGKCIITPPGKKAAYMKPRNAKNYVDKKLEKFSSDTELLFGCVNSLDAASATDQKKVLSWLEKRIYRD